MKKAMFFKRVTVVFLCVAMLISNFNININMQGIFISKDTKASAAELDTSTPDNIQEGTILQAFCWSFNTIIENMPDIAAAGYTAVQTSPIQECLATTPTMTIGGSGHWYYHYQPTDYTIGNYQLGDEASFKEMCDVAHSYGVKVIVDVVPNHTTVDQSQVSQNLIDAVGGIDKLYHTTGLTGSSNYSNRLECTTYSIGNLPDIDTENSDFQDYFINFLNQCIADGADGFRYDSAKHIGLSDDDRPDGVVNNFWERVTTDITNADSIFNYGEVLQGTNDRLDEYVKEIGATTASAYGASIRTALVNNNYLVSNISDYEVDASVDPNNLVTWVESHDNYYNDGTWSVLDNTQIVLGWAIITAREEGTPLFFSRPEGSSTTNEYGTNTIGIAGDDNYKNDQVVAVNKFRTAMTGEPENLVNPDGNAQILMIERGTKGAVIVNGGSSNYALDTETNLADGTYINHTADDSVFTVINGKMSGVLPARSVVVLYEAEATNSTTVHFYNADKWSTVYASVNGSDVQATNDGDSWWRATVAADAATGFTVSFHDGGANKTSDLTVNDSTKLFFANDTAYTSKADAEAAMGIVETKVSFFNSGSWSDVSAYAYISGSGDKLLGDWPGKAAKSEGDGWWSVKIPSAPDDNLHVIFNNNNNGSQSSDFVINDASKVYVTNENSNTYTSKVEAQTDIDMLPGTTVAYFYNNLGWDEVSAYTWGAVDLGGWPGTPATDVGGGWWKIVLPADPSMDMNLIFNNNNNGSQTGNLVVADITNRYFSALNSKAYPSKAAVEALFGSADEVTVYFYNYDHWNTVSAHATKGGVALGDFPAAELQNYWWSVTIPSAIADDLQVTFNDGTAENQSDTFTVNDKVKIYFTGYDNAVYASRTAAETAMGVDLTKTTVYFYNNSGWATVSAYLYGDCTNGSWPGQACTSVGNGWWKYDIPASASANLHVIFNNGGNGSQSGDFIINDLINVYTTNFNDTKYTSIEEAESKNGVTHSAVDVYFHNVNNWSTVYAYANNGSDLLGAAPGTQLTPDADGWCKVTIPAGASDLLQVSFNDGGSNHSDTFTVSDNAHVYYTMTESTGFTSKVEAQVDDGTAPTLVTVHYYNGGNWASVNAYVYGPGELLSGWPGTTATDEGDGWWQITIPSPALPNLHIIFNGDGAQSADFTINDFTNVYVTSFGSTKYASKDEASMLKNLVSIAAPDAKTGVVNGSAKTAAGLGLPATVVLNTDNGSVNANVTWDVNACTYDPVIKDAQTFTVDGIITLPTNVNNPNGITLTTTITVTVAAEEFITVYFLNNSKWDSVSAYVYGPGELLGKWPGTAAINDGGDWWKITIPCAPASDLSVIFNNSKASNGAQSATFVINDDTNVYVTNASGDKFASKAEAYEAVSSILESVTAPEPITGIANGTAKTVDALGLPAQVTLKTIDASILADVTWDLAACSYDPTNKAAQTFTVNGTFVLPDGITNPKNLDTKVSITVTVNAASTGGGGGGSTNTDTPTSIPTPTPIPTVTPIKPTAAADGSYVVPTADVKNQIEKANGLPVIIHVQLPDNANSSADLVIKADSLAAAANAGTTVTFAVTDKNNNELYAWSFNKDDLASSTNEMSDVNLALNVSAVNDDALLGNAPGGQGVILDFAYEGILPVQASVKVYVGNIDAVTAGSKVYLYHFNPETGKLETLPYSSKYVVDADGYITVNIIHCSDYVALTQAAPAGMITSLVNQISVTPSSKTLYVGGTTKSTKIKIELPSTLELVSSLTDKTSQNAIGGVTVSYKSSNSKVAKVDANGKITAVGKGSATITTILTLYSGKVKLVKTIITVKKPSIKITKSASVMKVGSKFTFKAEAYGLSSGDIVWTTSEKSIVTIDKKTGVATAKAKGTDYVIAKIGDTMVKIKVVVK